MVDYIEVRGHFTSEKFKDIPEAFKFDKLTYSADLPLLQAIKGDLSELANTYYRNYEIVGETYADFFEELQLKLNLRGPSLERILEAFNEDYDKFNPGTKTTTEYNLTNTSELLGAESLNEYIDVPADDTTFDKASTRDRTQSTSESQTERTGEVINESDNITGRPVYEALVKFARGHTDFKELFIQTFKNCFTAREVLIW